MVLNSNYVIVTNFTQYTNYNTKDLIYNINIKSFFMDQTYLATVYCYLKEAIDKDDEECYIGYEPVDEIYINELWIKKEDWTKFIDICIENGILIEEYELCDSLKKLKEMI